MPVADPPGAPPPLPSPDDPTPTLVPEPVPASTDSLEIALEDMRQRWRRQGGDRPGAFVYRAQFPDPGSNEAFAVLLYQEFLLRTEAGEELTFADYLEQFPQFAILLRNLRQADELVGN